MQIIVVAALIAVALANPCFMEFKSKYNKVYSSEMEEYFREQIYNTNVEFINTFNKEGHSWTLGVNEYADLLHTEFKKLYLQKPRDLSERIQANPVEVDVGALPASVDWRTEGAVTPVKNQGQCGSCWAFSTTGSIEGQHQINTGDLVSLSEQNLVSCSDAEGNLACEGGLMVWAFEYVIKNNGIDTEASYPYTSGGGVTAACKFNPNNIGATIQDYTEVPSGSESALQNYTAIQGPISVAMDASLNSFQLYKSGIYNPLLCSSTQLDHAVLAVGYGTSTADYWIVKNSWGTTWGEQGYFQLARNAGNKCGIATDASFPTGVQIQ